MFHRIQSVIPQTSYILKATFQDGTVKDYDLKPLFTEIPVFEDLKSVTGLYEQVRVDTGGYGISWNDSIDLAAEEIWENGHSLNLENPDNLHCPNHI